MIKSDFLTNYKLANSTDYNFLIFW